jgi:hypothetical protein
MAFTDERSVEICTKYGLVQSAMEEDGETLSLDADGEQIIVSTLDKNAMKVYTAPRNTAVSALKKSAITASDSIGYWCSVVDDKWELVFDADPSLIGAGQFTEIQE